MSAIITQRSAVAETIATSVGEAIASQTVSIAAAKSEPFITETIAETESVTQSVYSGTKSVVESVASYRHFLKTAGVIRGPTAAVLISGPLMLMEQL